MGRTGLETRLRAVDWSRYQQGILRRDIPDCFLGMFSRFAADGERSRSWLEEKILPQGVLVEAAYYAIPFLVEMIREAQSLETVYDLLLPVTMCAQPDAHDEGIVLEETRCSLTRACRERIATGIPYYLRDLRDADLPRSCRTNALLVLGGLPDWSESWPAELRSIREHETDPELRNEIEALLAKVKIA